MAKRGGFFGGIFNAVKKFVAPALGSVGKVFSGLLGGAKKQATQVAHRAINNVAQGAQTALKTGDWKGEAGKAFTASKKDAVSTAKQQLNSGRDDVRGEMSKQIEQLRAQLNQKMQGHYNSQ